MDVRPLPRGQAIVVAVKTIDVRRQPMAHHKRKRQRSGAEIGKGVWGEVWGAQGTRSGMANLKDTGHGGLCGSKEIRISAEGSRLVLQEGCGDGEFVDLQTGGAGHS